MRSIQFIMPLSLAAISAARNDDFDAIAFCCNDNVPVCGLDQDKVTQRTIAPKEFDGNVDAVDKKDALPILEAFNAFYTTCGVLVSWIVNNLEDVCQSLAAVMEARGVAIRSANGQLQEGAIDTITCSGLMAINNSGIGGGE